MAERIKRLEIETRGDWRWQHFLTQQSETHTHTNTHRGGSDDLSEVKEMKPGLSEIREEEIL